MMSTDCRGGDQGGLEPLYRAIRAELIQGPKELRHYRERPASREPLPRSLLQIVDKVYLGGMPGGAPPDLEGPLHKAIRDQDAATIESIAAMGFDLDGPMTAYVAPPVMIATLEWAPASVGALVKAGATVDAVDRYGRTAMEMVLLRDLAGNPPSEQRRAMVRALLEAGADPNRRSAECTTPLMNAAKGPDGPLVASLIAKGSRPLDRCECAGREDCAKVDGRTALHYAWHPDVVGALLGGGADARARDAAGRTPLMTMLDYKSLSPLMVQSARSLIAAGARLDDADAQGLTAAMRAGPELSSLLLANEKGRDQARPR